MASLKSFLLPLSVALSVNEFSLHERQRMLVRAGLLIAEPGKGPGSGVRLSARSVAMMLSSILASDVNSDMVEATKRVAWAKPDFSDACQLTGAKNFSAALATLLVRQFGMQTIVNVNLRRNRPAGVIAYKERGKVRKSSFGDPDIMFAGMIVSASIEWNLLRSCIEILQSNKDDLMLHNAALYETEWQT